MAPTNPPTKIANQWPSITEAGFTRLDAVAPVPGKNDKFYVFRGSQYIRIHVDAATLKDSMTGHRVARDIQTWSTIKNAGFTTIDAAMRVPGKDDQLYFFSGGKYLRCKLDMSSLSDTPYDSVDATMEVPGHPNQFYMFHGANYVRFRIDPETLREDRHAQGNIQDNWPTLKEAGFSTVDACMPVPGKDDQVYVFSGTEYIKIKIDKQTLRDTRV
ncbi:uncharacterized protein H6S33_004517 [Morchella sextelata]|uniref:uncharacterized protein n=1 Tax=Morchella sextelata TaxID=1174677 RepID=UPI001D03B4CB|nr:uncharacterized protein H6S33_004517 [Morchella sextelata]KAH0606060.1 hypothetical protein H6S33_004517 [Morchella sextelata]